jgi:hypothetical protein
LPLATFFRPHDDRSIVVTVWSFAIFGLRVGCVSGLFSLGEYELRLNGDEQSGTNFDLRRYKRYLKCETLCYVSCQSFLKFMFERECCSQRRISKNLCIRSSLCIFLRHPRRAQATLQDLSSNCIYVKH